MDSKTKHRILGVLIVVGAVIISLPFFQSGKELSSDAVNIKTPAFPDQPVQVTTEATPPATATPPVAAPALTTPPPVVDNLRQQQPDDTIKNQHPAMPETAPEMANPVVAQPQTTPITPTPTPEPEKSKMAETQTTIIEQPVAAAPIIQDKVVTPEDDTPAPVVPKVKKITKHAKVKLTTAKVRRPINPHTPIDDNGLFKLHEAAWVIQVGSFKNKANALRVVNNLRAKGYSAFIQRISSAATDDTRVFVGPENKQATARATAAQLESEMHLRGMVISYKPLAL